MKKQFNSLKVILLALICQVCVISCQDKSYLDDGGTADPYYNGTIMHFLESRPDLFKDLVEVIHYAEMEDVFDRDERSEEHTSELQSRENLVCRLLLEKKKKQT